MASGEQAGYLVGVVGAGPAGLYGARFLAGEGARVALFNRDIKPGGLAEYGIYFNKYKMRDGLRRQFRQILEIPEIEYFGNVIAGKQSGLTLEALREAGIQALVVTVGAQGTKWLGLPGEDLQGVYHAKDLVYHYNRLPPFSTRAYKIGRRVALIGVGNVMMDLATWLIREVKVDEVIAVARRGPAEVKFTKKESESVSANLDIESVETEVDRCRPFMEAVGQDPHDALDYLLSGVPKALEPVSHTRFRYEFLASPTSICGDSQGQVTGLELEDNKLVPANGDTKARGLGTRRMLAVDTVIFCIGDRVDENFGLPVQWNAFVKNPEPRYPVDGLSYEAYDPEAQRPIEGVFVAGWAREASSGLVGYARKDGENGARAVLMYLRDEHEPLSAEQLESRMRSIESLLQRTGEPVITKDGIFRLGEIEKEEAARSGLEEFKFQSNAEMLEALGIKLRQSNF